MSVLEGEVTRPDSFDPRKDYAVSIMRGGERFGDYDYNDAQRIALHDRAVTSKLLFAEGGIHFETGGIIAAPVQGVNVGGDELVSAGVYRGFESQNYTITITVGGVAGVAKFTWRSTGSDGPAFAGEEIVITAIAPSVAAANAEPEKYLHDVGLMGVQVAFVNGNGIVNESSWVIQVTYGARPPLVQKGVPNGGTDRIRCYDIISVVNGRPHRCAEASFDVPAATTGTTIIYGEWSRQIVTHANDPTLRDPQDDWPQGWRERWVLTYRIEDTSALPLVSQEEERRVFALYTWDRATNVVRKVQERPYAIDIGLTQGVLEASRLLNVDQSALLQGFIATRIYELFGHFVAYPRVSDGPRARLSTNTATFPDGMRGILVSPCVVYVGGVRIARRDPEEIFVAEADEVATVTNEQSVYDGTPFPLKKAVGERVFPIDNVSLLKAHVQVGTGSGGSGVGYEAHSHVSGVNDTLNNSDVVDVLVVSANANGSSPYTRNNSTPGVNEWKVVGDQIVWGAGTGNLNFHASYRYNRTMTENTDFVLRADGYIDFAPGGTDPVTGGVVSRSYTYYLPRIDAVVVRPNGDFQVIRGIAAEIPLLPAIPRTVLPYLQVELAPSPSGPVRLVRFPNDAIHTEQQNRHLDATLEVTKNLAIADLFGQARSRTSGNYIDILCDDFATSDLFEETYNRDGVDANALLKTDEGELTTPFTATVAIPVQVTSSLPAGTVNPRIGRDFFTLPYVDEPAILSDRYSEAYPVNPYADFTPEPPETRVTPDQDVFEDVSTRTSTEIEQIRKTAATARNILTGIEATRMIREFRARFGRAPRRNEVIGSLAPEVVGTATETIAARHMRQLTLTLTGIRYVPGEKLRVKFDGKDAPLTNVPASGSSQGTGGDTAAIVTAPDTVVGGDVTVRGGYWSATVVIPPEVPVGTRLITVYGNLAAAGATWNSANPAAGGYEVRATLPFTSEGTERITVTQERQLDVILEPIAQSFVFPQARMVSKVDIPLATKPENGAPPLVFQVRATDRAGDASTPIDVVLESLAKEASQVAVGPSSHNEFVMGDPVLCFPDEFRSLVLRSSSDKYQAYIARLGAADLSTGGTAGVDIRVNEQAIPGGIFMDSANNRDWTPHQGWDLRMALWVAKMTAAESVLYYDELASALLTGFTINVDQVIPDGTAIAWEYSVDGLARNNPAKVWVPCVALVPVELPAVASVLALRAKLTTTSLYVTPGVHRRNLSVLLTSNATSLVYVTKVKQLTENATHIKGEIELLEAPSTPTDTTKVYVTVDGDSLTPTWRGALVTVAEFNALLAKLDTDVLGDSNYAALLTVASTSEIVAKFNALLAKLDLDSVVSGNPGDYAALLTATAHNLNAKFVALLAKLDADSGVPMTNYAATLTSNGIAATIGAGLEFGGTHPDGFSRYTFDVAGFTTAERKKLRVRIESGTPDRARPPRIRQFTSFQTPV